MAGSASEEYPLDGERRIRAREAEVGQSWLKTLAARRSLSAVPQVGVTALI